MCFHDLVKYWSTLSARTQDALISIFGFTVGLMLYFADLDSVFDSPQPPMTVRLAVLAVMCLMTFFRRRQPVTALAVGLVPLTVDLVLDPSVPIWLLYSDLIYASVLYGRGNQPRYVTIGCAAVAASGVSATLAITGEWWTTMLIAALLVAFIATPIWRATIVFAHKSIADAERKRVQAIRLVAEFDRRATIAEERKLIARDLHDVIAGHLSAIAIQSEAALDVLARRSPSSAMTDLVGAIRSESVDALQEMRTMLELLGNDDGPAAPQRLAQLPLLIDAATTAGSEVRVRSTLNEAELPSAIDQAAYRIVHEALTNAIKHAPGQPIDIGMHTDTTTLTIVVRNPTEPNSSRSTPPPGRRCGLIDLHERATALGGGISAGPVSGAWEVVARLPLTTFRVEERVAVTKENGGSASSS